MSDRDVRAGVNQAKASELGMSIFAAQALIFAGFTGFKYQSWGVGLAALFGFLIAGVGLSRSETIAQVGAFVLGAIWAGLAFALLSGPAVSEATRLVAVTFAFLIGIGANLLAFQHLADIGRSKM